MLLWLRRRLCLLLLWLLLRWGLLMARRRSTSLLRELLTGPLLVSRRARVLVEGARAIALHAAQFTCDARRELALVRLLLLLLLPCSRARRRSTGRPFDHQVGHRRPDARCRSTDRSLDPEDPPGLFDVLRR